MNRRSFFHTFIPIIVGVFLRKKTLAAPLFSKKNKNYVLVSLFESPPRWLFDLVLKPSDQDTTKSHPFIANEFHFDEANNVNLVYRTVQEKGYHFSSLVKKKIPTSDSSWVPLSQIFENALVVRGCDMRQDGHPINSMKLEAPAVDSISLGGMLASQSNSFFPAIGMSGKEAAQEKSLVGAFKTPQDERAIPLLELEEGRGSYIEQLFSPYRKSGNQQAPPSVEESFFSLLRDHLTLRVPASKSHHVRTTIKSIENLPIEKIILEYNLAQKKYEGLISKSLMDQSLEHINNKPIPGLKLPASFPIKDKQNIKADDYIGAYKADDVYVGNADLRSVFQSAQIPSLSHQFAMTEVTLKFGLSNVILFNVDPIQNLHFENSYAFDDIRTEVVGDQVKIYTLENKIYHTKTQNEVLNIDGHNVGAYIGILGYSLYYRAVASGLNEFIAFLKKHSLFDETLVHLTCEFERKPRSDMSGSDHGWKGHTSTFISGMVPELKVVGNILVENGNSGTWGEAATLPEFGRVLNYNDMICSIADVLGVKSPVGGQKIFSLKNTKIVANIEGAKNLLA